VFKPLITAAVAKRRFDKWERAVEMSRGWVTDHSEEFE